MDSEENRIQTSLDEMTVANTQFKGKLDLEKCRKLGYGEKVARVFSLKPEFL